MVLPGAAAAAAPEFVDPDDDDEDDDGDVDEDVDNELSMEGLPPQAVNVAVIKMTRQIFTEILQRRFGQSGASAGHAGSMFLAEHELTSKLF